MLPIQTPSKQTYSVIDFIPILTAHTVGKPARVAAMLLMQREDCRSCCCSSCNAVVAADAMQPLLPQRCSNAVAVAVGAAAVAIVMSVLLKLVPLLPARDAAAGMLPKLLLT